MPPSLPVDGPPPAGPDSPDSPVRLAFHDVTSADGTRLRAWTNDPDRALPGPTVLLCNGLGTNAHAWPALLDPACRVRVVSWAHRGVGGSERPVDGCSIGIDAFVEDALAVMDDAGVASAPTIGWSMGVNTQFELATRHPDRVEGLFAVAGVPGATFSTMLELTRLPAPVRGRLTVGITRVGRRAGPLLTPVARALPIGPTTIRLLGAVGFMGEVEDEEAAAVAVREFLTTPLDWYFHMALHTARHQRVSLSRIDVPAVFVAGSHDILAGPRAMRSAAERMPDARYVELPGSHFVGMEHPGELHDLLVDFLGRLGERPGAERAGL
ncbi:alpha/beta hydrolase [Nocardioides sp. ChNu-153]|uniref:alpha/beta fold hydrolase n=1 Tax=unclassified Nocardioides TaxID=2615069 RepID=UPI002407056B|nr:MULTISPECIES: alpha/beta hydrolase [unclassified Nocardioides]MDF9716000.1 alpha/beta hydrolase [Nocardioides sp. ChNu-99]MDN7119968.1 alpha/beta hydrolase [Nocardioides sp. ChNu-153]